MEDERERERGRLPVMREGIFRPCATCDLQNQIEGAFFTRRRGIKTSSMLRRYEEQGPSRVEDWNAVLKKKYLLDKRMDHSLLDKDRCKIAAIFYA